LTEPLRIVAFADFNTVNQFLYVGTAQVSQVHVPADDLGPLVHVEQGIFNCRQFRLRSV
jgi:hypothetical protein